LGTRLADNLGGCMGENSGDLETTRTLNIHEIGRWSLNKLLKLVSLLLNRLWWISEIVRRHGFNLNPERNCRVFWFFGFFGFFVFFYEKIFLTK
jgi:hypothetical protein